MTINAAYTNAGPSPIKKVVTYLFLRGADKKIEEHEVKGNLVAVGERSSAMSDIGIDPVKVFVCVTYQGGWGQRFYAGFSGEPMHNVGMPDFYNNLDSYSTGLSFNVQNKCRAEAKNALTN